MKFNRRDFLQTSLLCTGGLILPKFSLANKRDPHFYIQLVYPGGVDTTYLFDARPLAFTQNELLQNYLNEEPNLWTDGVGMSTYATKLTYALKEYKNDFSIINGIIMSDGFDGHDQNLNMFLTGSAFGGESFIPHLKPKNSLIDYMQMGSLFAAITNASNSIPLDKSTAQSITHLMHKASAITGKSRVDQYLSTLMSAPQDAKGLFSQGAHKLGRAYQKSPDIYKRIKGTQIEDREDDLLANLEVATSYFKQNLSHMAVISLFHGQINTDCHDSTSAKRQHEVAADYVHKFKKVMKFLKETPFDANRSYFDVTTVSMTSEFGRTMRQKNRPLDDTGTDHNPMTNTLLIGGKGIKGNQIIGQSDWQSVGEKLSGAHISFDKDK